MRKRPFLLDATSGLLIILVFTTITTPIFNSAFLPIVCSYLVALLLIFLSHMGSREEPSWLSKYIAEIVVTPENPESGDLRMNHAKDTSSKYGNKESPDISVNEANKKELIRGIDEGFPVGSITLILLVTTSMMYMDLSTQITVPQQLYGIFHSAMGGLILTVDRFRGAPGTMKLGSKNDGRYRVEGACGFLAIFLGFILQTLAVLL